PQIEIAVVVAGRRGVVGGRAEPGDQQQVAAALKQRPHRVTAPKAIGGAGDVAAGAHFTHTLAPSSRCDSSTAVAGPPLKVMSSAAATVSAASSARSIR